MMLLKNTLKIIYYPWSYIKLQFFVTPGSACEKELELLHILTSRFDNYHNYEQLFPLLVDRVTAAATIIITNIHETAARYILFCMKKMIKVMTAACTPLTNVSIDLKYMFYHFSIDNNYVLNYLLHSCCRSPLYCPSFKLC